MATLLDHGLSRESKPRTGLPLYRPHARTGRVPRPRLPEGQDPEAGGAAPTVGVAHGAPPGVERHPERPLRALEHVERPGTLHPGCRPQPRLRGAELPERARGRRTDGHAHAVARRLPPAAA